MGGTVSIPVPLCLVEPDYEYVSVENEELAGTERVEDYKETE